MAGSGTDDSPASCILPSGALQMKGYEGGPAALWTDDPVLPSSP
jgi:hypothetical protein